MTEKRVNNRKTSFSPQVSLQLSIQKAIEIEIRFQSLYFFHLKYRIFYIFYENRLFLPDFLEKV